MGYKYEDFVKNTDFTFWFNVQQPFGSVELTEPAYFTIELEDVPLDLLVTSVNIDYNENNQITTHLGETFNLTMFGKTPATATITASLLDSKDSYGKNTLVGLYRDYLRPSAVARTQKMPSLMIGDEHRLTGPIFNMKLTLNSEHQGVWDVAMTMQIMRHTIMNTDNDGNDVAVEFDYTVGEDTPIRILNTNAVEPLAKGTDISTDAPTTTEEEATEETPTEEAPVTGDGTAKANYKGLGNVRQELTVGDKKYTVEMKVTSSGATLKINTDNTSTNEHTEGETENLSQAEYKKAKALMQNYFENGPTVLENAVKSFCGSRLK